MFGGTFDPPHLGHLVAANEVRDVLDLDRVLLVVANRPWQKVGTRPITEAPVRLAMVQAAVAGLDGLEASDLELRRGGDSYTADTLAELATDHPDAALFVILGADAAALLPTWERVDEVRRGATIVAYERAIVEDPDGAEPVEVATVDDAGITRVRVPRVDVSSTSLRARIARGRTIDVLCPPGVIGIIEEQGLYRDGNP